jgi:hypothetical protein
MNTDSLLQPTIVAAVVSVATLLIREAFAWWTRRERLTVEADHYSEEASRRGQEILLKQIESLWQENAAGRSREIECRTRCRELERQCNLLERRCGRLESRLDGLGKGPEAKRAATEGVHRSFADR